MESPNSSAIERPPVALCHAHADLKMHLPDFLIISPPKTGSTWLASNLQCHPAIFVSRMKEVKYFSTYHRWLDLDWYAGHFRGAGTRQKGEASPSYALLPRGMIRWIHSLMPHVKLVFLMRDPVGRAWSHARHNCRYREANFETFAGELETVPEEKWRENFRHPWPLASGDYLGQLQRWLSVFPREQIYVDLYEGLATDPQALLQRIFAFLGVATGQLDWSAFRLHETILPGEEMALAPGLRRELQCLLQDRTRQLKGFLREEFGLCVRQAWENTLESGTAAAADVHAAPAPGLQGRRATTGEVFARAFDDEYLANLLDTEIASSDPQLLVEGYYDYNLVLHRGHFLALAQSLGDVNVQGLNAAVAGGRDGPGILRGDSLAHLKERVAEHMVGQLEQKLRVAEQLTRRLAKQEEELQTRQGALEARLVESELFMSRLRNSLVFRVRRKVGPLFTGAIALLRSALGNHNRSASGSCQPPGREPGVDTPRSPVLAVLPQKPP